MAEERELILKLGQKITDRIGHKVTVEDPEYYGLACVVTDEMAEIALKMKVRKPMTLDQVAKATGKSKKYLEPLLQEMSSIGLLEYNWENPSRTKQYVLPMFVPGSAEFFNMKKDQIDAHPELAKFFERMTFLPLEKITAMVPPGGAGIGMHVIPVEKAIETENQSVDVEHISHWLKKYEGKYAAGPCSCRMSRAKLGEGCGDDAEDWCIGVGDMADYLVETNKGHYVTYDQVLEILQRAEDNGFVHQITNIDGENKIFAICNCNVNICNALRTSQLFNTPNMSRSAYIAKVDKAQCVACGRCVEYCPAGAVKLGQKLCTKDGGTVTYPRQELPDKIKWGPEKWSPDYRDKNRINCYDAGTAPCKTACPAHIAVQGYLKLAAQGRYKDALALIKKENPFPAVCGHVCNRRCEDACTRGTIDRAVAIDEVKKFAEDVLERFNNPFVDHAVTSIMLNSFPKYETRDLPGLKTYLERKGELPKGLVLGLAAIITYYKGGVRADGAEIVPNDAPEIMNLLKELWATGCTKKVTEGVLAAEFIWGEDLNKIPGLAAAVKADLDSIQEKGMLETVKGIL